MAGSVFCPLIHQVTSSPQGVTARSQACFSHTGLVAGCGTPWETEGRWVRGNRRREVAEGVEGRGHMQ